MKVLLVNNRFKQHTARMAEKLAEKLRELDARVDIEDAKISDEHDLIIVLGGDGTILRAARQYAHKNIPILGVNMGTVGFLSNIEVGELDSCLQRLLNGDFDVEERMMLRVNIYKHHELAESIFSLNEIVIRATSPRMVSFNLVIDGENLGSYRGDGLIFSSPTGSTAYSLSAGGPICDPQLDAFLITPIAPYLISKRPMVLSSQRKMELIPVKGEGATICIDGQIHRDFNDDTLIRILKAEFKLKLVDMKGLSFFNNIDNRLRRS